MTRQVAEVLAMPIREVPPKRDGDNDYPENGDDGGERDRVEQQLVHQAMEDFAAGGRKDVDAGKLREAEAILQELGYTEESTSLHSITNEVQQEASDDFQRGANEIKQAKELHHAHHLAALVRSEPQQLVTWQGAIKTITHTIERSVPEAVFIAAANGDIEAGRQNRSEVLRLGEWLSHLEASTVQTAEQALRVGLDIVSFVAGVQTIYDHIPEPVKHIIGIALQTLLALFH